MYASKPARAIYYLFTHAWKSASGGIFIQNNGLNNATGHIKPQLITRGKMAILLKSIGGAVTRKINPPGKPATQSWNYLGDGEFTHG